MKPKVIFAVQGEGRGHMTQALSLKQVLEKNGFEISCVLVGSSERREIPSFFSSKFEGVELLRVKSPNFVTKNNRGINISRSVWSNLRHLRKYIASARILRKKVEEYRPQLIINFYEPVVAIYSFLHKRLQPPVVSVAHQYLGEHPEFEFPVGRKSERFTLKNYSRFTAKGSSRILALSFYPLTSEAGSKLRVVPPLLRSEVRQLQPQQKELLLCYLVNNGYRSDIENWHAGNPEVELHVFTDTYSDKEVIEVRPNLFFHKLNDVKFLQYMSEAKGVISSAGFESICEALYLDKPVLMVPVEGHFEQYCNAHDGFKAGAGIFASTFDITRFLQWIKTRSSTSASFREWENSSEQLFMQNLREVITERIPDFPVTGDLLAG